MKLATIFLVLLTASISTGQDNLEIPIDDFHTIKSFDLIKVNLIKSDENKILIQGRDRHDVEHVLKDGLLKIRMETDKIFDGKNTFVNVYYTDLKTIDANEGSIIYSNELMQQDELEIRVQEGATVQAGLELKKLNVRAVTGGILKLSGKTQNQKLVVNTGGVVENQQLQTEFTSVKVQAGGEVEVHATEGVDVLVRAGGDVIVYGNPKSVKQKSLFGGSIVVK
jgi:hypothetical protein